MPCKSSNCITWGIMDLSGLHYVYVIPWWWTWECGLNVFCRQLFYKDSNTNICIWNNISIFNLMPSGWPGNLIPRNNPCYLEILGVAVPKHRENVMLKVHDLNSLGLYYLYLRHNSVVQLFPTVPKFLTRGGF